jgi:hypothetical protein
MDVSTDEIFVKKERKQLKIMFEDILWIFFYMQYSNGSLGFIPRSTCGICNRKRGTVTGFSLSTSVLP